MVRSILFCIVCSLAARSRAVLVFFVCWLEVVGKIRWITLALRRWKAKDCTPFALLLGWKVLGRYVGVAQMEGPRVCTRRNRLSSVHMSCMHMLCMDADAKDEGQSRDAQARFEAQRHGRIESKQVATWRVAAESQQKRNRDMEVCVQSGKKQTQHISHRREGE